MRCSIKTAVSVVAFMALASAPVLAQVATFDDLPSGSDVPFGYAVPGMQWFNWGVINPSGFDCDVSPSNCAFNGFGTLNSLFESATPFDFNGGYFMAWYRGTDNCGYGCPIELTVNGWLNGVLVGTMNFDLNGTSPSEVIVNYDNVNLVTFDTHSDLTQWQYGNWFLADNLVFNDATVLPEPASLVLLATGMVSVFGVARRRRVSKQG